MKLPACLFAIPLLIAAPLAAADEVQFSRDIRPILWQNCLKCHGPDKQKSGLRLDDPAVATHTLKSGFAAIAPGKPESSELLKRLTASDPDELMPPPDSGIDPLTADQITKLKAWITAGAKYETHWAYVSPIRPPSPAVGVNPVDAFINARLQREKLAPAPPADRYTLIRRLSFDLTGLSPTVAEADAFAADKSPGAYEKLVDRLLASPRYGEKWARWWLDLARYGDSAGYQHDVDMPLWLYRDWVVAAFNSDMPVDRFAVEQIAGDLLPGATVQQRIATGFNRCATATLGADNDAEELRAQLIWDRVNTFGTAFLAASLECAQCHNHKFDPIAQRDYYHLYAYFNRAAPELTFYPGDHYYITGGVIELPIDDSRRAQYNRVRAEISRQFQLIDDTLKNADGPEPPATIRRLMYTPLEHRTPERIAYLFADELKPSQKISAAVAAPVARIRELSKELETLRPDRALVMEDSPQPPATHLLHRGNIKTPGERLDPATPAILHPAPAGAPPNRLGLARWLVSNENPLTARVMVNRWWAEFFGAGIVATVEDFGLQGDLPTHPELLDWLAVELRDNGWSMKKIHKIIVTSAAYQRTSIQIPASSADPQNRLLARGPRLRLDAETLRDNALSIAGLLHHQLGGRPVPAESDSAQDGEPFVYRRSVYVRRQRGEPNVLLATFDAPDRFACTAKRARSNTPLQALALLNDRTFVQCARALAQFTLDNSAGSSESQIAQNMFRAVLIRPAAPPEIQALLSIYQAKRDAGGTIQDAWFQVANVLMNLDEAITRE